MGRHGGYFASMFIVAVACCCDSAQAEVKIYSLPIECADFAFNHDTGDLAMVVRDTNEAWLIRSADLQAGKFDAPFKLKVGAAPCSIFYKKYKDMAVYAIVCSKDSHMYLMNAGDGSLLKKIQLDQSVICHVSGSINPADPFVYYDYGDGRDNATGALNLRTMQNQPLVFDSSFLSFYSASGEVAYRLGPWMAKGFESLLRTTSLTEDRAAFRQLHVEDNMKIGYAPDPFDRYTASAQSIFNRDLNKRVADLSFLPQCFFRKTPIVVGFERFDEYRGSISGKKYQVRLRAASYNTFSAAGNVVSFELSRPSRRADTGGSQGRNEFGFQHVEAQMFANDFAKQAIFATPRHLVLVPLGDFGAPEEPFLYASLKGGDRAVVGRENKFSLELLAPGAEVQVESMPDGMQAKGNDFTWTPNGDQLGSAEISVALKHGDLKRSQVFDLQVVRPSLELPFAPLDAALSGDRKRMLIWEGTPRDHYGLPHPLSGANGGGNDHRMAVIDLTTGATIAEKKVKEPIWQVCAVGDFFVLVSLGSRRFEVLRATDLERAKSLVANTAILSAGPLGQMLVLQTEEGFEIYSLAKLERVAVIPHQNNADGSKEVPLQLIPQIDAAKAPRILSHRLLAKGVLLDEHLKTSLIFDEGNLSTMSGADGRWRLDGFASDDSNSVTERMKTESGPGLLQLALAKVPHSSTLVKLDMRLKRREDDGGNDWEEFELMLNITADPPIKETILRGERSGEAMNGVRARQPRLIVSGDYVFSIFERKLYRFTLPKAATSPKLAFTFQQSALALSGQGTTTLTHEVTGGKAPYQFTLLSPLDDVSIDEKTGTVTLTEKPWLERATIFAGQDLIRRAGNERLSVVDYYLKNGPRLSARATEILVRKATGYPVAIPIRVEVTDAEQTSAVLQYFVIAEISRASLGDPSKAPDEKVAGASSMPDKTPAPGEENGKGDADLRRKVEALEKRVDELTRLLGELLRKSDDPK